MLPISWFSVCQTGNLPSRQKFAYVAMVRNWGVGNRTYIKTLLPGSKLGRWHLTSFNGETIFDAEIVDAYPVGWINRT